MKIYNNIFSKFICIVFFSLIISCGDDNPSTSDNPPRNVKYAFSGSSSSGPERVSFMIEHNGNMVLIEPNHSYPYITNEYGLHQGDNVYVFAENVSLVTNSTIRIDLIVDSDTVKTVSKSGESPSVQISEILQ